MKKVHVVKNLVLMCPPEDHHRLGKWKENSCMVVSRRRRASLGEVSEIVPGKRGALEEIEVIEHGIQSCSPEKDEARGGAYRGGRCSIGSGSRQGNETCFMRC